MKLRSLEPELFDEESLSREEIRSSLDFMVFVNRRFGGMRAVLRFLERAEPPAEFSVLDIGTGSGDIPNAVARWAEKRGRRARVTAIDKNPLCLEYAERRFGSPQIRFVRHSAFDIESLGQFDYVTSSMFFHHLNDGEIVALLKAVARCARLGFIVNDLCRGYAGLWGAALLSRLTLKPIVINDAALSIRRAFRTEDFTRYLALAGINGAKIERPPFFRITMSRIQPPRVFEER